MQASSMSMRNARSISSSVTTTILLLTTYLLASSSSKWNLVQSFTASPSIIRYSSKLHHPTSITSTTHRSPIVTTTTQLTAKKQKNKKKSKRATRTTIGNRTKPSIGFGGGSIESCHCGSEVGYGKCCGRIHSDATAFAQAGAEAVVRARYTAYAKREIDFIIGSTHPLNKDFKTDIDHWKKTIAWVYFVFYYMLHSSITLTIVYYQSYLTYYRIKHKLLR